MVVVDTNVLVRYLVKDDEVQTAIATKFLANNDCLVLKTILLETVWVLSSKTAYRFSREVVIKRIKHLFKLPRVFAEDFEQVRTALIWYKDGMDFADALHLAASENSFVTFDEKMVKKASQIATDYNLILLKN